MGLMGQMGKVAFFYTQKRHAWRACLFVGRVCGEVTEKVFVGYKL